MRLVGGCTASCLPDLIQPTYVLVMPGLLNEMAHRPHGLLEVTQGDLCHVRATVLPPRINLPILQEFLKAFCWRGWPLVRCVGTHNRVPLTDELQDCRHGFFVQITITRAIFFSFTIRSHCNFFRNATIPPGRIKQQRKTKQTATKQNQQRNTNQTQTENQTPEWKLSSLFLYNIQLK